MNQKKRRESRNFSRGTVQARMRREEKSSAVTKGYDKIALFLARGGIQLN